MSRSKGPKTELKDLKTIVDLMRSNGVLKLKALGYELEIAPSAIIESKTNSQDSVTSSKITTDQMSEEELLFWSAPGSFEEAQ